MQNSIVRNILVAVLLIVFCYMVGSAVAEDYKMSAVMIAALVGVVFMLIMGTRSWVLLFYLPALITLLPLRGGLALMPDEFYICPLIFGYYILLWTLGYVKFCWRPLVVIDLLVLLVMAIMVASYIRRPVSVNVLGLDYDQIGGREYVVLVLGLIYYLAISCIPMDGKKLPRVMNWAVALTVVAHIIAAFTHRSAEFAGVLASQTESIRFSAFYSMGRIGILAIFAYYSLSSIFTRPLLLLGLAVSSAGILLSGTRAGAVDSMVNVLTISFIKRQMVPLVGLGIAVYSLLFVLGGVGALSSLPMGMQRIMAEVPGVKVSHRAVRNGEGTWNWRLELWERAWDPRTGYIKDYVWGDGFGYSVTKFQRGQRAAMRGELRESSVDGFAGVGLWHNGVISTVHRLGYVGLGALSLLLIISSVYVVKICCMLRGTPLFCPVLFYTVVIVARIPEYCWGAHGPDYVFEGIGPLAIIKLAYHEARKMGIELVWFRRQRYEPLMIQQYGERIQSDCYDVQI